MNTEHLLSWLLFQNLEVEMLVHESIKSTSGYISYLLSFSIVSHLVGEISFVYFIFEGFNSDNNAKYKTFMRFFNDTF